MNRLYLLLLVSMLCSTISITAQQVDKNPYLLPAPFDGYLGRPNSLESKSYYIRTDLKEEDYEGEEYKDISEDQRYDIIRGAMYASKRIEFDKNGYPMLVEIKELADKKKKKGKLTIAYKQLIERDENSLATKRTLMQRGKTTAYYLESRENNIEKYKTRGGKGSPQELTIEYQGDTIVYTESETITRIAYEKHGFFSFWEQETPDGMVTQFSVDYAYGSYEQDTYYIVVNKSDSEKTLDEERTSYMLYEMDETRDNRTAANRNWTRRDRTLNSGFYLTDKTLYGFDEQVITYPED